MGLIEYFFSSENPITITNRLTVQTTSVFKVKAYKGRAVKTYQNFMKIYPALGLNNDWFPRRFRKRPYACVVNPI